VGPRGRSSTALTAHHPSYANLYSCRRRTRCDSHADQSPHHGVITITGIGDHLRPEWPITITGTRNEKNVRGYLATQFGLRVNPYADAKIIVDFLGGRAPYECALAIAGTNGLAPG